VVPGVTSIVAGPALAGIPVTHRGVSGAVLVVSGHDDDAFEAAVVPLPANALTIVIAMGMARRSGLAARLMALGWAPTTPAAIVADASRHAQQVWRGSLEDLALGRAAIEGTGPALIIVGAVAALDVTARAAAVHRSAGRQTKASRG
jgi:siroheme synthase